MLPTAVMTFMMSVGISAKHVAWIGLSLFSSTALFVMRNYIVEYGNWIYEKFLSATRVVQKSFIGLLVLLIKISKTILDHLSTFLKGATKMLNKFRRILAVLAKKRYRQAKRKIQSYNGLNVSLLALAIAGGSWAAIKWNSWYNRPEDISTSIPSTTTRSFMSGWMQVGMWVGGIVFTILLLSIIIRALRKKSASSSVFDYLDSVWSFIRAIIIGILGYALINLIWWAVDEPYYMSHIFRTKPFFIFPLAIVFGGMVKGLTDGVSRRMGTYVNVALSFGAFVWILGLFFSRNIVTEPQDGRNMVAVGEPTSRGARRGHMGFDPVVKNAIVDRFQNDSRRKILIDIAACESDFNHWTDASHAEVIRSDVPGSSATGVFQILSKTHGANAARLGLKLEDLDDNIKFAGILFDSDGTAPWNASRDCWLSRNNANEQVAASHSEPRSDAVAENENAIASIQGNVGACDSNSHSSIELQREFVNGSEGIFQVAMDGNWSERIPTKVLDGMFMKWDNKKTFLIMAIYQASPDSTIARQYKIGPGEKVWLSDLPSYIRVCSQVPKVVTFARVRLQANSD